MQRSGSLTERGKTTSKPGRKKAPRGQSSPAQGGRRAGQKAAGVGPLTPWTRSNPTLEEKLAEGLNRILQKNGFSREVTVDSISVGVEPRNVAPIDASANWQEAMWPRHAAHSRAGHKTPFVYRLRRGLDHTDDVEDRADAVIERLVESGTTLRQILEFTRKNQASGKIHLQTSTEDLLQKIVIPETSTPARCYMESDFMVAQGGQRRAKKFVAHAFGTSFLTIVLSILLDATGWTRDEVLRLAGLSHGGNQITVDRIIDFIPIKALDATYWLSLFAVNQHRTTCGDCMSCRRGNHWTIDEYIANPCLFCRRPKLYPCHCGAVKYTSGDDECEIDKFDAVVSRMDSVVVVLDDDLKLFNRMWPHAEICEGMASKTLRVYNLYGLSDSKVERLRAFQDLAKPVENCKASSSDEKFWVLDKINCFCTLEEYNDYLNCLLEISFGRFSRLRRIKGIGRDSLLGLTEIDIDLTWRQTEGDKVKPWKLSDPSLALKKGLHTFSANLLRLSLQLERCKSLVDINELGEAIPVLKQMRKFNLNCSRCAALTNVSSLGQGLAELQELQNLTLDFSYCGQLAEVHSLGYCIGKLQKLQQLELNLAHCWQLTEITSLGQGIHNLRQLRDLNLDFFECERLDEVTPIGYGIQRLALLKNITVDFQYCHHLSAELQHLFTNRDHFLDSFGDLLSGDASPAATMNKARAYVNLSRINARDNAIAGAYDGDPLHTIQMFLRARHLRPKDIFKNPKYNKDGGSTLSPKEIHEMLKHGAGLHLPFLDVEQMVKEIDTDGNGALDAAELDKAIRTHKAIERSKPKEDPVATSPKASAVAAPSTTDNTQADAQASPASPLRESKTTKSHAFTVTLDTLRKTVPLGMETSVSKGGAVLVMKVKQGLVDDWNKKMRKQVNKLVLTGDEIIAVNGVKDDASKIIDTLNNDARLEIQVLRGSE